MGAQELSPDDAAVPPAGRILAVDPGEKRIGIAISDPSQTVAQPLTTLTRRAGKRFPLRDFILLVEEHTPVGVVMGLPLAPDGSQTPGTVAVQDVGALIHGKIEIPVVYRDERMSTARVHKAIREMGGGTRGRKQDIDQLAATVLLQTYLDSRRR